MTVYAQSVHHRIVHKLWVDSNFCVEIQWAMSEYCTLYPVSKLWSVGYVIILRKSIKKKIFHRRLISFIDNYPILIRCILLKLRPTTVTSCLASSRKCTTRPIARDAHALFLAWKRPFLFLQFKSLYLAFGSTKSLETWYPYFYILLVHSYKINGNRIIRVWDISIWIFQIFLEQGVG